MSGNECAAVTAAWLQPWHHGRLWSEPTNGTVGPWELRPRPTLPGWIEHRVWDHEGPLTSRALHATRLAHPAPDCPHSDPLPSAT